MLGAFVNQHKRDWLSNLVVAPNIDFGLLKEKKRRQDLAAALAAIDKAVIIFVHTATNVAASNMRWICVEFGMSHRHSLVYCENSLKSMKTVLRAEKHKLFVK